jgi:biotin carboxyl carrier protein
MTTDNETTRTVDPRAVRVAAIDNGTSVAETLVVLEPAATDADGTVLVDGEPTAVRLERHDKVHAGLVEGNGSDGTRTPVLLFPREATIGPALGVVRREVVVGGWSIAVEVESERRASLRERARHGREVTAHRGPTEIRAIIPGRILSVSIVPGDAVVAGQQLLVVEAMKMQNELRAPRDGVVSNVAVGPGGTIEVGDLLLVLQ